MMLSYVLQLELLSLRLKEEDSKILLQMFYYQQSSNLLLKGLKFSHPKFKTFVLEIILWLVLDKSILEWQCWLLEFLIPHLLLLLIGFAHQALNLVELSLQRSAQDILTVEWVQEYSACLNLI